MKYDHNQVNTAGGVVETGQQYCYSEDSYFAIVEVLEQESDENGIGFLLRPIKENYSLGKERFHVWASNGRYAYSGMWRLWDKNEYVWTEDKVEETAELDRP